MFGKIHIGRSGENLPNAFNCYIGRPSPLGNPWVIGVHGTRAQVIKSFEESFEDKVKNDSIVRAEVIKLYKILKAGKDVNLQCFCAPDKDCHGRVIKKFLEEVISKEC